MSTARKSILLRCIGRLFSRSPDFLAMLAEQSAQVARTAALLADFMLKDGAGVNAEIQKDQQTADLVKVRNIHALNAALITPIEREAIYRAITDLSEVVGQCKTVAKEMTMLGVEPDAYSQELAKLLQEGMEAVAAGFDKLASDPLAAARDADTARRAERRVEKLYRSALVDLFQGSDYINMFKRREIYFHLSKAAERMAHSANTLHDIVVRLS